jgi:type I restriction enzyme S subunit
MNAERLLKHYESIADAPEAIARLRRFIFDLAVRGKLVPQDPNDEPASELLKRIAAEKARLIKAGVIRTPKPSEAIRDEELPITLPKNWGWLRLCDIGNLSGGMTPSMNRADFWGGDIVWLSPKDIKTNEVSNSELRITAKGLSETRLELYRPGCLFMVARSGILKRIFPVSINRVPAAANQDMKVLVPFLDGQERYLQIMFQGLTDFILDELVKTGTTVQSLKYAEFEQQPFPLPPLAEQRRIVAKVDELMALCDRLEAARAEREAVRDQLAGATLARLNAPPDPETFQDDTRFALDALPALTVRPDQIKQLRHTILNLALCGKLVSQDPNDEPASELLKRIAKEKTRLMKAGKVRDALSAERDQMRSNLLPLAGSWKHVTVAEVAYLRSGVALAHDEEKASGDIPYVKVADLSLTENNLGITTSSRFVGDNRNGDAIEIGSIVFPKRGGAIATNRKRLSLVKIVGDSNLMAMKPYLDETRPFIEMWFNSFDLWTLNSGTSVPQINNKDIYPLVLPLPPLAEQGRIVAQVDQLMAVCDRLEASLTATDETRRRLLDALLAEALVPIEHELAAAE